MIDFPIINRVAVITIDLIAIWLAFLVYKSEYKTALNKIFLAMVPMMLGWVNFAYLARIINPDQISLSSLLLRIAWFVTPGVFVLTYFFVVTLTRQSADFKLASLIVIVMGALSSLMVIPPDLVIQTVDFVDGDLVIIYGEYMLLFLLMITVVIVSTLYPLIRGYKMAEDKLKTSIEYVFVGVVVFYGANLIFNITLPIFVGIGQFYYLGDYSLILLLGLTALATIKLRIMGVKVFFTQLLVAVIFVLLVYNFILSSSISEYIWQGIILISFFLLGNVLVRSVRREVRQREKLSILTEELKVANEKLKKLDDLKTEFLSITSHQLRTPLSGIRGYLSMMIEGDFGKFTDEQQPILNRVTKEVERLIRLVQVFLNVSRIESGRLRIDKVDGDMVDLAQTAVAELKPAAEEKGLQLTYEPGASIKLKADFDKLKDVVVNLVDNAIKYTKEGSIAVTTKISEGRARLEVKDTGVGIEPSYAGSLFEKFTRAEGISQVDASGSGLGLFIVKKIIEGHEGKVWAESEGEGKGSTFIIEVPIEK